MLLQVIVKRPEDGVVVGELRRQKQMAVRMFCERRLYIDLRFRIEQGFDN